jgi:hypothetical protein
MESVIINGVEYVEAKQQPIAIDDQNRPYVIVRCRDAGVHAGYLVVEDRANGVAELAYSRRLWRWHGRTLSGLALEGTTDASRCKFGPVLPAITLRDWCEIIPCSQAAVESLAEVAEWVNE